MARDDGYDYLTLHGHRRRVYHELTGLPIDFQDVWSVFGPDLSGRQVAVRVQPRDACRRSKLRRARLAYSNCGTSFVVMGGADLPRVFEACEQDFGQDLVWLDVQAGADAVLLEEHRSSDSTHRDFHLNDDFAALSGNRIIYHNHDGDMGEIYSPELSILSRLINHLVLNFVRNKTGIGTFKRAPGHVLRLLKRATVPDFPSEVSAGLVDLIFSQGITVRTENLRREGDTIMAVMNSGLPEFYWLPEHLKENGPRSQLAFDVSRRLWSLEKLD